MVEMQARVSFDSIYAMGEKEELEQCEQEFLVRQTKYLYSQNEAKIQQIKQLFKVLDSDSE